MLFSFPVFCRVQCVTKNFTYNLWKTIHFIYDYLLVFTKICFFPTFLTFYSILRNPSKQNKWKNSYFSFFDNCKSSAIHLKRKVSFWMEIMKKNCYDLSTIFLKQKFLNSVYKRENRNLKPWDVCFCNSVEDAFLKAEMNILNW